MGWTRPSFEAVGVNIDALYMFTFADIFKHRQSFASSTYKHFVLLALRVCGVCGECGVCGWLFFLEDGN